MQSEPKAEKYNCLSQITRIGWHRLCSILENPRTISSMTAKLTTHVLDTYNGKPASGVCWKLEFKNSAGVWSQISAGSTNEDGRSAGSLITSEALITGSYRLKFDVANYFSRHGVQLSEPPFWGKLCSSKLSCRRELSCAVALFALELFNVPWELIEWICLKVPYNQLVHG